MYHVLYKVYAYMYMYIATFIWYCHFKDGIAENGIK